MEYNGKIVEFLESLNDRTIDEFLDSIFESPDVDKRMDLCDDLIDYLQLSGEVDDYFLDSITDDIKDLAIN